MDSHISNAVPNVIWLLCLGLCLSCSRKNEGDSDAKDAGLQTDQQELTTVRADAVMPRIIAYYSITKPPQLEADYNLGYTLFVVTASGVMLTADASTLYDYRVDWENTHLNNFSDSGAVVDFGKTLNLNSAADTIKLGQVMISSQPGALVHFVIPIGPPAGFPASVSCETLLADSTGIVCALGFSSKPQRSEQ